MKRRKKLYSAEYLEDRIIHLAQVATTGKVYMQQVDSLRLMVYESRINEKKKDAMMSMINRLSKVAHFSAPKLSSSQSAHLIYHHNG